MANASREEPILLRTAIGPAAHQRPATLKRADDPQRRPALISVAAYLTPERVDRVRREAGGAIQVGGPTGCRSRACVPSR